MKEGSIEYFEQFDREFRQRNGIGAYTLVFSIQITEPVKADMQGAFFGFEGEPTT